MDHVTAGVETAAEDRESAHEPERDERYDVPVSSSRGQRVLHPTRETYLDLVTKLHEDGFWVCVDLTVVDYLTYAVPRTLPVGVTPERFEVVANLLNHRDRTRVRIRVQVPETDASLPSLFALHPGTEALEREAFDMFGVVFDEHPDLTRILLPEEWEGHPLRKDEPISRIPVQFKDAPEPR